MLRFSEEIDGLPPNGLVKELVLRSDQTGLGEEYLRDLRLLFPKMRALTIEIEDAWFVSALLYRYPVNFYIFQKLSKLSYILNRKKFNENQHWTD